MSGANKMKLLIADDETEMLNVLKEFFEARGADVTTVKNAEAALELVGNEPFDCLVTDLRMPGMGGIELLKRIKDIVINSRR